MRAKHLIGRRPHACDHAEIIATAKRLGRAELRLELANAELEVLGRDKAKPANVAALVVQALDPDREVADPDTVAVPGMPQWTEFWAGVDEDEAAEEQGGDAQRGSSQP